MAKLTETVSAVTPLGDALREPAKAPRKRRASSSVPEPLGVAWSCPCHGTRFDDLREIYLHIRAELQARTDARKANGARFVAICGTNGGYAAHRRRGEEACRPCLDANAAHVAAWAADKLPILAAAARDRRAANRDAYNARERARRAANRDAYNADRRNRRAARKAAQQREAEQ